MTHSFKKDYWERHWAEGHTAADDTDDDTDESGPNPHLIRETNDLAPGIALDAGCGTGAEAIWLATRGWQVTGADISATTLARAADRAAQASVSERVTWVEADLTTWTPDGPFDLVVTSYAHPAMPQPTRRRSPSRTSRAASTPHSGASTAPRSEPEPSARPAVRAPT